MATYELITNIRGLGFHAGNGSPEGVVQAPKSDMYLQRDSVTTTGALWIKASGSGNTGWVIYSEAPAVDLAAEIQARIDGDQALQDQFDNLTAASVGFVPSGTIMATDTQSAIAELDTETQAQFAALPATYVQSRNLVAPARGAVIFCIDDCKTQAKPLIAIHDALGQKAVLGVVSSLVDTGGFMTSAEILAAHQNGHELANHSNTHPNYTSITASQRRTETDTCQTFITNLCGVTPQSFIYPQGAWSATTDRELCTVFRNWRLTISPSTNLPATYPLGGTNPRYYALDVQDPLNFDRAKALIRQAAVSPIVVSTYVHYTNEVGVITTAQYQELAQLAHDLGVPAVLSRDMVGSLSRVVDPSFEVANIPNWFDVDTGVGVSTGGTITPDVGISGTNGLILTSTAPDTAGRSQTVRLAPGKWRVSGRIKLTSGNLVTNDFALRVRYRNWDETALSFETFYPTLAALGTWARFEQDYTVPEGTSFGYLDLLCIPGSTRAGTLQVDHVDIRPTSEGGLG